ncbi:MAG: MFS transporter [Ilumatobacteraceae bacterium]
MADVAPALSPTQMRWLMGGLMVGLFVSAIEQSIVATSCRRSPASWVRPTRSRVVSVYLLTSTVVTPLYGKMSDLFGRRVVYRTALTMFAIGSVLCAVAPSMGFWWRPERCRASVVGARRRSRS